MTQAVDVLAPSRLAADLNLGPVELTVSDLSRSLEFYTGALGLKLLSQEGNVARLGAGKTPLLTLAGGARTPTRPSSPGLYHFALLLPTRADLGRFVRHFAGLGLRLGQGDHLVSEAFYTNDPDGHGIEVYWDRPRETWPWQDGQVQMGVDPIDVPGLLAEPGAQDPFTGLPDRAVLGHVHLRVTDLPAARAFYAGLLGFDVMADMPGALFVSVGGYHHHLGLNTWQSAGGPPAPADSAHLLGLTLILPDADDLARLQARLDAAAYPYTSQEGALTVRDPSGTFLRFTA